MAGARDTDRELARSTFLHEAPCLQESGRDNWCKGMGGGCETTQSDQPDFKAMSRQVVAQDLVDGSFDFGAPHRPAPMLHLHKDSQFSFRQDEVDAAITRPIDDRGLIVPRPKEHGKVVHDCPMVRAGNNAFCKVAVVPFSSAIHGSWGAPGVS